MPTVLELLGVAAAAPHAIRRQLRASICAAGAPPIAHDLRRVADAARALPWSDLRVVRDGRWKYILAPRPELYDLAADPGELRDLVDQRPGDARGGCAPPSKPQLKAERERRSSTGPAAATLSAETLQKLGALGYVSPERPRARCAQGADPKDKIEEFRQLSGLMREGLTCCARSSSPPARPGSTSCARSAPTASSRTSTWARRWSGWAATARPNRASSGPPPPCPASRRPHLGIVDIRMARRDWRGAPAAVQRGEKDAPNEPVLYDREGQIWQQLGDAAQAMTAYRRVAALAPKDALVRWRMGELLLTQRQPEAALAHFKEATTLDPTVADYWNSLGMVLGGGGQHDDAARAFREALTLSPKNAAVRLQPRPGADAGRPARGGRLVPARPDARPQVRAGAAASRGTGATTPRLRRGKRDGASARQGRDRPGDRPAASANDSLRGRTPIWREAGAAVALAVATAALFWPIVGHGFLNWDDPDVVAANPRLHQPPAALLAWAFSTREMGHYQPLSWLALAAVAGEPASPARVHGLAVALHAINAGLLMWLITRALDRGDGDRRRWAPALAGAALFALHPLRVEPVAWASALPYLISYAPLLVAVGAWIAWLRRGSTAWLATSVGLFAVSQFAAGHRAAAPDRCWRCWLWWSPRGERSRPGPSRWRWLPFVVIGVPLAVVEAGARDPAPLGEVGLGPRLAWTLIDPALYAWRTLTGRLPTPVETIPRAPEADWTLALVALAASAAAGLATWRLWSARAAVVVWGSYLALLAPVVGVLPSGLQVTASRYAYGPAMVLSAALAAAIAAAPAHRRRLVLAGVALLVAVQAAAVRPAASDWRDSVTLWTAATASQPRRRRRPLQPGAGAPRRRPDRPGGRRAAAAGHARPRSRPGPGPAGRAARRPRPARGRCRSHRRPAGRRGGRLHARHRARSDAQPAPAESRHGPGPARGPAAGRARPRSGRRRGLG